VVEAMALSGDASDNVPGIPGIGPKTAFELIQKYGTLENVLAHVDEISGDKRKENLRNFADQARLSKELVTLDDRMTLDVAPEDLKPKAPDRARLLELFRAWGFKRFQEDLLESMPKAETNYTLVDTPERFAEFLAALRTPKRFALDTETTGVSPRDADLVGLSFSWSDGEAHYLPLMSPLGERTLDAKPALAALKPILEDPSVRKVGQNIKYDGVVLLGAGIDLKGVDCDTMLASWVLNPGKRRHALDDLAVEFLGRTMTPIADLIGKGKKQVTMADVPTRKASDYSCADADFTWRLAGIIEPKLKEAGLGELFVEVEVPLIEVLRDMEWAGVAVDVKLLRKFSGEMGDRLATLEKAIYRAAGEEFNIDSPAQLGKVLFEKLELPWQKKTKTGARYSTDEEVLEKLASMHELPRLVVEYRKLAKLKGTYVDALPTLVSPRTGRIHASFNMTTTATGRLSSSDPNLQNIPVRTEEGEKIREAFVAGAKDSVLVGADYSQIELRILAHFSRDPELVGAFTRGDDIHAFVASQIYGIEQDKVTSAQRGQAKTVNFGIMYGQTPYGLSAQIGIPVEEAEAFIAAYYRKYHGVEQFFEGVLKECQSKGYVSTILGRRRYLQDIRNTEGSNRNRNQSERMAINTVCQGSAADMIKKAMIAIHRRMKKESLQARLILQIHDELVFETPEGEVETLKTLVAEEMKRAIPLSVPLVVNLGTGKNWREIK
jgi:DNA polymerase-1